MTFHWTGHPDELFTRLPIEWLRFLGAPSLGDDEFQIIEAAGATQEALLADYLDRVLAQWRDYGFVTARIDIVKLLPARIGTQVFGAYDSNTPVSLPRRISVQIQSAQSAVSVSVLDVADHR